MSTRREHARELRQQGQSIGDIAAIVAASKSTVSTWVRDIHLSQDQINTLKQHYIQYGSQNRGAKVNRLRHQQQRAEYQESGRIHARHGSQLHLTGCMLYWAEGAKSKNEIHFVNSDPHMMLTFVRFLREELGVTDDLIAVHIHCHTEETEEISRIENYWLNLLNLPKTALKKTQIKSTTNKSHNVLRNGVCGVKVHRTEVLHHIYGAIQEYCGFDNPDWLF